MIDIELYTTNTCMPCKILKKRLEGLACDNLNLEVFNAIDYPEKGIMATPHVIAKHDGETFFEGHLMASKFNGFIAQVKDMLC